MKTIDKAYLAGLIDGEGCIYVNKGKYLPDIRLLISQCINNYLPIIRNMCDGIGNIHPPVISFNGYYCIPLLEQVIPYLIVKKQVAIIALDYLYIKKSKLMDKNGLINYSEWITTTISAYNQGTIPWDQVTKFEFIKTL